eukprot:COSAG01_NODE_62973_length_282_cov_0.568306_1_plen_44_part_10
MGPREKTVSGRRTTPTRPRTHERQPAGAGVEVEPQQLLRQLGGG